MEIEKKYYVRIEVAKFKEILVHSWDLLPKEMQLELREIGIYPR